MADQYGSLVDFEEEYNKEVSFYIGSTGPLPELSSPSPEVNPKDQERESKKTAPSSSIDKATSGESTATQNKVIRKSNSKSKLIRSDAVYGHDDGVITTDVNVSVSSHGSNTGAEQSPSNLPPSKDVIMKLYLEREKSFTEEVLNKSPKMIEGTVQDRLRSRSRTPGNQSPSISVGLDHLDNLVRLMEQLSNLKEENSSLKRKCCYLEDAKSLLQARNNILRQEHRYQSTRSQGKGKGKSMHYLSTKSASAHAGRRHCTSDSSDTPGNGDPIVMAGKLHHRSQSVGSIEVDNVDIDLMTPGDKYMRSKSAEKAPRDSGMRLDHGSFAKLTSKWERVKKVFSGKPEAESKNEKSAISAEQLVRANSKPLQVTRGGKPQPLPPQCVGNGSEENDEARDSNIGALEPPSPSSVQSEPAINITMDDETGVFSESLMPGCSTSPSSSMFTSEGSCVTSRSRVEFAQEEKSQFLTVQTHMRRRQSSPTLSCSDETELDQLDIQPRLSRSSSYRGSSKGLAVYEQEETHRQVSRSSELRKFHKAAWGKVKDIISVRKDSTKLKQKRSNSLGDALIDSHMGEMFHLEVDDYESHEGYWQPGSPGNMSRNNSGKSPQCSPSPHRRQGGSMKSMSVSPPPASPRKDSLFVNGSPVDVSALIGGVSEDFNKKMQEWEEKKRRGTLNMLKEGLDVAVEGGTTSEEEAKFSKEFIRKMEEWEKMKGLDSPTSQRPRGSLKLGMSLPESASPPISGSASPAVVENLSESFSKTVQEWHRIKTQRSREPGSPTFNSRGRKDYRSKSRERDRSRSKYDKQRERDMQRLEKKEQKIEREKQKLEKLRQKLEMESCSSTGASTVDIQAEASSQDEARKCPDGEGESNTGAADTLAHTVFCDPHHTRSHSAKDHKEMAAAVQREQGHVPAEGILKSPLQGQSSTPVTPGDLDGTPNYNRANSVPTLQRSHPVDESTSIDIRLTASDSVTSLESQNRWLSERLTEKEEDLSALQDELQQLTMRINYMDQQHFADIKRYKRELWASSSIGHFNIEIDGMNTNVAELKRRLEQLQIHQQTLVQEKQQLQALMQEEAVMRHEAEGRLIEVTTSLPPSQHSDQDTDGEAEDEHFQKLCSYLIKLHTQVGDLHLGVQERNQLLQEATRQLLLQEVNNCLLQADATRRHLQVQMLRDARRNGIIKRWKSFSGKDRLLREERRRSQCEGDSSPVCERRQSIMSSRTLQKAMANLRHGSLDQEQLTSDILNALCQQKRKAAGHVATSSEQTQTDDLHQLASAFAQTVMTLCNVPYSNPPTSRQATLETKSIQTSMSDLRVPADGIETTDSSHPEKRESKSKGSAGGMFAIRQMVDYNQERVVIAVHRTTEKVERQSPGRGDSRQEVLPSKPCINLGKSKTCTTSTHTGSHSSHSKWTSEGKRPHSLDLRTERLLSRGGLYSPVGASSPSPVGSKISPTISRPACASGVPPSLRPASSDQTCATGAKASSSPKSDRRGSTGGTARSSKFHRQSPLRQNSQHTDDENFSSDEEVFSLQPQCSPIIRSRYPRKQKSDLKNNQVFPDPHTWKATPPRKAVRHRRSSTEKTDNPSPRIRERTKSDSFPLLYKSSYSGSEENKDGRPLFRYERESQNPPVQEVISKFEQQASNNSLNRPPPSPTVQRLSPVRRLKTAAELLQDSQEKRSAYAKSKRSASVTREAFSLPGDTMPSASCSSDKENKKKKSYVKQMVQSLSREGTPEHATHSGSSTPRCSPGQVEVSEKLRKLSASTCSTSSKPPFSDLTNDSKKLKSSISSHTPNRVHSSERQSPPNGELGQKGRKSQDPVAGTVSKRTELFEKKIEQTREEESRSRSLSRSRSCSPARITQSDTGRGRTLSVKPDSTIKLDSKFTPSTEDPWQARREVKGRSHSTSGVGYRSSYPSQLGPKELEKLHPGTPAKGGAVKLLCRQALSVDVASSEDKNRKRNTLDSVRGTQSMEDASDRRRNRTKFLDGNWLQKPKKFFKASKC